MRVGKTFVFRAEGGATLDSRACRRRSRR